MATAKLQKGQLAEEVLRNYFIKLGYFAVRGVPVKCDGIDLTDIDILLFGKKTPLTRERINVDVKNKKTSQASERIFFASGICSLFGFDTFFVATQDKRDCIKKFSAKHRINLLDGEFLKMLLANQSLDLKRIPEELLIHGISQDRLGRLISNFSDRYLNAKSRLSSKISFSTCNELISDCNYFAKNVIDDASMRFGCLRALYAVVSYFLVSLDYVYKDLVLLSEENRVTAIRDGFMFGEVGQSGVSKYTNTIFSFLEADESIPAASLSVAKKTMLEAFNSTSSNILSEFFSQNSTVREMFKYAKEFEQLAFSIEITKPEDLPSTLKSILFMLLDCFEIDRTTFVKRTK